MITDLITKRNENVTLEKIGEESEITPEMYAHSYYLCCVTTEWYPDGPGIYLEHHKDYETPLKVFVMSRNAEDVYIETPDDADYTEVYDVLKEV